MGEGELFGCGNPLLGFGVVLPSEESARFNPQYPAEMIMNWIERVGLVADI